MRRNRAVLTTVAAVAAVLLPAGVVTAVTGASTGSGGTTATPVSAEHGGAPGNGSGPSWGRNPTQPRLDHVFIIMEENHALDHTIGDVDHNPPVDPTTGKKDPNSGKMTMPYLTALSEAYGHATDYYGVTHTSEPNYIAATSGDNWWVNNDNEWDVVGHNNFGVNHYDHTNIVDELDGAHIPWAAYMQAMPSAGYLKDSWPSDSNALYVSKHNPFVLYTDIHNNPAVAKNMKPYSDMARDLNSRNAPRYVWISPDLCTDMHLGVYSSVPGFDQTPCPYPNSSGDPIDEASKVAADNFIRQAVTTIMHSRAWTGNSVIFITADENDYDADSPDNGYYLTNAGCCDSPVLPAGDPEISANWPGGMYGGGLVPMVVISRNGPRHATDGAAYNHYSMLLTIEEGLGLGKLGYTSDASQVKPMWPLIESHSQW